MTDSEKAAMSHPDRALCLGRVDSIEVTREKQSHLRQRSGSDSTQSTDEMAALSTQDSQKSASNTVITASKKSWKSCTARRECGLKIVVLAIFVVMVISLGVIFHFYAHTGHNVSLSDQVYVSVITREMLVKRANGDVVLRGQLGHGLGDASEPADCSGNRSIICLQWTHRARLLIEQTERYNKTSCYDVSWLALDKTSPGDCFVMDNFWFGGGLLSEQKWPLNDLRLPLVDFVTGAGRAGEWGPVIGRNWLVSSGVAIHVHSGFPLRVSFNGTSNHENPTNRMCLFGDVIEDFEESYLNYTFCVAPDMTSLHKVMMSAIRPPTTRPPNDLYKFPLWSTWAKFKTNLDQHSLLNLMTNISQKSYRPGKLLLDLGWQDKGGDLRFDLNKFPNIDQFLAELRNIDISLCPAVHPLSDFDSESFQNLIKRGYLVRDASDQAPGLVTHMFGSKNCSDHCDRIVSGLIDLTNDSEIWWRDQLNELRTNHSLDTCYFTGGEVASLPYKSKTRIQPVQYTTRYNKFAASVNQAVIAQSAYDSQSLGQAVMLHSLSSTWEGLQQVIPRVLTLGLLGYQFIIPDVIGGSSENSPPSKELYIRWLELSTFLPTMHFSVPPQDSGSDVERIAESMMKLRQSFVSNLVLSLADKALSPPHAPIIRPLWWISPHLNQTLQCDSQFLLGDDVMVAPIVTNGALVRDLYLPPGDWRGAIDGIIHQGPGWLRNYQVELDQIAYFTRLGKP